MTTSSFIYPTITIQYLTIRERYSLKIEQQMPSQSVHSPPIPISDVFDDNLLSSLPLQSPILMTTSNHEFNNDIQQDNVDIRLQTDMEQILDVSIYHSNEEQEQNRVFLQLRSSIISYVNKHNSMKKLNLDDLFESLHDNYSFSHIFSQLLYLCASTQRYYLHSTSNSNLFLETLM